jgi:hypothetical protein
MNQKNVRSICWLCSWQRWQNRQVNCDGCFLRLSKIARGGMICYIWGRSRLQVWVVLCLRSSSNWTNWLVVSRILCKWLDRRSWNWSFRLTNCRERNHSWNRVLNSTKRGYWMRVWVCSTIRRLRYKGLLNLSNIILTLNCNRSIRSMIGCWHRIN